MNPESEQDKKARAIDGYFIYWVVPFCLSAEKCSEKQNDNKHKVRARYGGLASTNLTTLANYKLSTFLPSVYFLCLLYVLHPTGYHIDYK